MSNSKCMENSFHEVGKLTPDMLDSWIDADFNVLFIGEHGTGKTERVKAAFQQRFGSKWVYFSGATLDPWIHVVGVPHKVEGSDGKQHLDFVLPKNLSSDVEAIFIDEFNRTHKVVANALMELVQFKSINGRKFPNLKVVWAAINPPNEDDVDGANFYTVDPADPAQLDRFQVIVQVPSKPDRDYFFKKFGNNGRVLTDWHRNQPEEAKKMISPRRLEYIAQAFEKNVDLRLLLPRASNVQALYAALKNSKNEKDSVFFAKPTVEEFKKLVQSQDDWEKHKEKLISQNLWQFFPYLDQEILANECAKEPSFEATVAFFYNAGLLGYEKIKIPEGNNSSLSRIKLAKGATQQALRVKGHCFTGYETEIDLTTKTDGAKLATEETNIVKAMKDAYSKSVNSGALREQIAAFLLVNGITPRLEQAVVAFEAFELYKWTYPVSARVLSSINGILADEE